MRGRLWWLWAAALITAAPLYYWLSLGALQEFLNQRAIADGEQLRHGFRWDFDSDDNLAGPPPAGIATARLEHSILEVPRAGIGDFLSLNLRGEKIDARVFDRVSISIDMQGKSDALLFFRGSLDGPDYVSEPLPLRPGPQDLRSSLDEITWRIHAGGPSAPG